MGNNRKMESDLENVETRYIRPDEDDDGFEEWVGWTNGVDTYKQQIKVSVAQVVDAVVHVLGKCDLSKCSKMDFANRVAWELGLR